MKANNLSVIGSTVQLSGTSGGMANQSLRRVLVTLISNATSLPPIVPQDTYHIEKVLLKAVCKVAKKAKKDPKTFTLRNINTSEVCSGNKLKNVIKTQLWDDIVTSEEDFEVGVVQGNSVVSIRSKEDMMDVWKDIRKGTKVVLWCDGLRATKRKRQTPQMDEEDSDEEGGICIKPKRAKMEERENKVHDIIKELKEKHGNSFSPMQLRIWSEMVVGEMHSSLDEPPSTSMFIRAGNTASTPKKKDQCGTTQALTEVATAIASALSPPPANQSISNCGRGSSPAKLIEGRSKCYKQLSELNNLKASGIINNEEYLTEKESIMAILNTLKTATRHQIIVVAHYE